MTNLSLCYDIYSLIDLSDRNIVLFYSGKPWTLISKQHGIEERLPVSKTGMTQTKLLTAIGKIYDDLAGILPGIPWKDDDGKEEYAPFWGDHAFLEGIDIDHEKQEVHLHFGS